MAKPRSYFFQSTKDMQADFFLAIQHGKFEEVEEKLSTNKYSIHDVNAEGYAPLHIAAKYGHAHICELLLEYGADIDAVNPKGGVVHLTLSSYGDDSRSKMAQQEHRGQTPLFLAVQAGHLDVSKLLLSKGANVNIRDAYHVSPLYQAVFFGNHDMVTLLIKYHPEINAIEGLLKETVLHAAVRMQQFEIVKLLIKHDADINAIEKFGLRHTPLHLAIKEKDIDIARYLLEQGADGNIKDKNGKTPLELTDYQNYSDLLYYGFNRNKYTCRLV